MFQQLTTSLIRLYPFEKGRDRILGALKVFNLFQRVVVQAPEPAKLRTGQLLYVSDSEYMSDYIRLWGEFERKTELFILSHLENGCQFLDVGANFGYFSIVASQRSFNCNVRAVEPNPVVAQALRESVRANGLSSKVEILEMALSDESGLLPLISHKSNLGLSHLGAAGLGSKLVSEEATKVKVEVWDEWIKHNDCSETTTIIKMDIEGAELKALVGMKTWLLTHKPAIVVEANDGNLRRFGGTRKQLEALLFALGYKHVLPADNNFYMTATH